MPPETETAITPTIGPNWGGETFDDLCNQHKRLVRSLEQTCTADTPETAAAKTEFVNQSAQRLSFEAAKRNYVSGLLVHVAMLEEMPFDRKLEYLDRAKKMATDLLERDLFDKVIAAQATALLSPEARVLEPDRRAWLSAIIAVEIGAAFSVIDDNADEALEQFYVAVEQHEYATAFNSIDELAAVMPRKLNMSMAIMFLAHHATEAYPAPATPPPIDPDRPMANPLALFSGMVQHALDYVTTTVSLLPANERLARTIGVAGKIAAIRGFLTGGTSELPRKPENLDPAIDTLVLSTASALESPDLRNAGKLIMDGANLALIPGLAPETKQILLNAAEQATARESARDPRTRNAAPVKPPAIPYIERLRLQLEDRRFNQHMHDTAKLKIN